MAPLHLRRNSCFTAATPHTSAVTTQNVRTEDARAQRCASAEFAVKWTLCDKLRYNPTKERTCMVFIDVNIWMIE